MLLLFAAATVMLKIFPDSKDTATAATAGAATDQTDGSSPLFGEGGEKFVAHRGYSNYAPENSIPAFELAGKIGFWGIETDISETSDGQFVCMHDEDIDRTTDGSGMVGDYTLEQLGEFRIDKGNYLKTTENLKIPTLGEYLEICAKYGCVAVVEIKTIQNYESFLNTIINSGLADRCIITGEIEAMKAIRAMNNSIPVMTIGYTPAPYTDNLAHIAEIPFNRGILYNYPQVTKTEIDILHQQGIYCGVWSVDETDVARTYLDYGADFIVTNEIPARLDHMVNENE